MAETRRLDNRRETPIEPDPNPLPPAEEEILEPKVSVILISHNQVASLRRAVAALERSTGRDRIEILVVDLGSSDDSPNIDAEFEGIHVLRLPHHFGATKTMNIATRTAKGELMFYLSPNVEVAPDTVMKLAEYLENDSEAAAVGPVLVDPEGHPVSKSRKLPTRDSLAGAEQPIDLGASQITVEFANLDALMVRKFLIKGINYFDERFGHTWADADLAMQIRRAQKRIRLYPDVRATYHNEPDPLAGDPLLAADQALGAAAYFGKYDGFLSGLTFRLGAIFGALGRFQFKELAALVGGQKLDGSQNG